MKEIPKDFWDAAKGTKWCDLKCPFARFPRHGDIDGSLSCRTYLALWCEYLGEHVTKNSPCSVLYGKKRPKTQW